MTSCRRLANAPALSEARRSDPSVHTHVTFPCNDEGMIEHDVLDAGLGDGDDDDFDLSEVFDSQLPDNRYLDRELSWLAFNQRVLELAEDPALPVLERANFLAIFASNLDEFFMVRVAGLKRRIVTGLAVPTNVGRSPQEVLADISADAHALQLRHADAWTSQVRPALADAGIEVISWDQLEDDERTRVSDYFQRQIFPVLMPLAVDPAHPFPYISGLSLNLAIRIRNAKTGRQEFARLKVPPMLPRFVDVSRHGDTVRYLPLEELIANHLEDLFPGMEILDHHAFRLTRNEDVVIEEDETENLIQALEAELLRRRFGPPIRLEVTDDMDDVTLDLLISELDITEQEVYRLPGLLDLRGLFELGRVDRPELRYPPHVPTTAVAFQPAEQNGRPDIFAAIRKSDVLVHHPYESFATSVQAFLDQAAKDPHVLAIKQTLYRTSGDSPIVQSLIDAAESGKQVLALVEVKARFDEAANIVWARKLEKAGVHVVYGLVGLKTHCKLALVIREEDGVLRHYSHIGTGNYNPKTSRIYEDFGLFTTDGQVGKDLTRLFNELSGYAIEKKFKRLLVAPLHLRKGLLRQIDKERRNALDGRPSGIRIKVNSMVDEQIIDALYRASQAGVKVDILVRGICSIKPGVEGMSENITVRSILGRYLEHSRIFAFHNDGDPQIYIGSADMMHRNLDRRVEALVRVVAPAHINELTDLFDLAMNPATSSWWLGADGEWTRHSLDDEGKPLLDLQDYTMASVPRRRRARAVR
jgi:polyphosphate kinase